MTPFRSCFLFSFVLISCFLRAQDTAKSVPQINFKQEIVIDDKRYRIWDNWVTAGAGGVYHSNNPRTQFVISPLDICFHIKQVYFNIGGFVSGDSYGQWNVYQLHAGYVPWRLKSNKYHMAVAGGISYSSSRRYLYSGHYLSRPDNLAGIYGQFQLIRKIEYTDGLGLIFFVDANKRNLLAGVLVAGYLSGAYRGYVKGKEPKVK
ncbi:MAG TPA: hypothetical protein VI731_07520 [Bacteroidia bacterium]|nr:hypothetical protein [Bacteroidia bacterium]